MPLANGAKFAGYTIERQLGAGGMGEVYLAQHPRLPRHDAIKVLKTAISSDPDYIERFNREADLASKLWHPHIVGILDRGKYRGRLWISMDFVDGDDASRLLDEHPDGMPVDDALAIVEAVASALDYSHSKGLLHRDVKPANILLADAEPGERRILLGDFGVARDLSDNTSGGLTATNMTVGTAAYAAPEQLMGLPLDGRADQYSLAATAYHLLTGKQPYQHSNAAVVISQHLNADPPSLGGARPELARFDAALSRAMAKDPDERFATCADFVTALEEGVLPVPAGTPSSFDDADTMLRAAATVPAAAAPQPPAAKTSRRRGPWIAAAAAVVLVVVALVGYFALAPAREPSQPPFSLAGSLRLANDAVKTSGLPAGYGCAGAREFGDVGPNAPITVENESGTLLAKGSISAGYKESDGCVLRFRVADVPAGAQFYRVHVAQHPEMSYTEAEAKAGVELLMGTSDDPTTSSSKPTRTWTPTRTSAAPPPPNMEQVSLARLQRIADEDRSSVASYLADRWIPQISSKRVGLEAKGITWNNQAILDEHLRLRGIYPNVRLLWSGDWSTYDGRNFWVTVVGLQSDNPYDILDWCTQQGFDRDNCIAKIVSTTHAIDGSTKLLP
ncbi:protein kinase [Mycobacterium antarcticum]|uniref:serine/threonine-protein kinase n=1 Tax=unclassified Mycolicibacterium TaxID=2636767 RepID=UPI002386187F|nr:MULTISPECIES: serine/threonine-protein kinase [unclassified Mycolicibacterium]BDX32266.1 protein kinase [Mycolicibacterium sp. TUM20985]GLP84182.1 protein kinase [Mycolicibacterium sp. TUM20984]